MSHNTGFFQRISPSIQGLYQRSKPFLLKMKRFPWWFSLSALFFAVSLGTVLYYILGPSEGFWHSDCTDSLYWANATVESGQVIADNYRYAALLPFSANLWMTPLIRMFGFTITTQLISMVIFALFLAGSYVFLGRALRFSWPMTFTSAGCLLMLLSGSAKLREILWEHVIYYSLALLLFNLLLGLLLKSMQSWDRYRTENSSRSLKFFGIWFGLFCILSVCSATNGFQLLLMTAIPLFAAVLLYLIFDSQTKLLSKENGGKLAALLAIPLCSVLGLLILNAMKGEVTAGYTDYYSSFSASDKWMDHLLSLPRSMILLFGFEDSHVVLTEKMGILNLLSLAALFIILLVPLIALFLLHKCRFAETKFLLFANATLSLALVALWIFGNISNANWRLVPIIGFSGISFFAVLRELFAAYHAAKEAKAAETEVADASKAQVSSSPSLPLRLASLLLAFILLFSLSNQKKIREIPRDYGRDNVVHQLTNALLENDLEYGFATFWYSQAITLLSDSQVKCREILADNQETGPKTDYYQSSYDWYQPQEGIDTYFLLLTGTEYNRIYQSENFLRWYRTQLVETIQPIPGYYIFVFKGFPEGIR